VRCAPSEDGLSFFAVGKGSLVSAATAAPYQPFAVSVVPDRREVAVVPHGDLDLSTVDQLAREVRELREVGFEEVLLDLRHVDFIDSSGLRLLLSLRNDAKRDGHVLRLVPGRREVQRIFELTATRSLFNWRDY
jgi:anti-anti-sigma factor